MKWIDKKQQRTKQAATFCKHSSVIFGDTTFVREYANWWSYGPPNELQYLSSHYSIQIIKLSNYCLWCFPLKITHGLLVWKHRLLCCFLSVDENIFRFVPSKHLFLLLLPQLYPPTYYIQNNVCEVSWKLCSFITNIFVFAIICPPTLIPKVNKRENSIYKENVCSQFSVWLCSVQYTPSKTQMGRLSIDIRQPDTVFRYDYDITCCVDVLCFYILKSLL